MKLKTLTAGCMLVALAACGGGGSGSGSAGSTASPVSPIVPVSSSHAAQTVSFRIPAPSGKHTNPSSTVRAKSSLSSRAPLYVSPDTAGFTLSIDGHLVFNNASALTPGTSATTNIPGETGTASYTITGESASGVPLPGCNVTTCSSPYAYFVITAQIDVLPGQHTVGVVLTAADGFVLSEDQETYTLAAGANPNATMYLKGVVDSAFWCDANCDGGAGTPAADGTFTLEVFATDHEGDAIAYQTAASTPIQLDNGPVTMVETDGLGTLAIGNAGPFTDPGAAFPVSYTEAGQTSIQEGYSVTLKCLLPGTATVAMKVGPSSVGGVTGFNYGANIDTTKDPVNANSPIYNPFATPMTKVYTTGGQLVGSVPVQQDFGNQLTITCDAGLGLSIM